MCMICTVYFRIWLYNKYSICISTSSPTKKGPAFLHRYFPSKSIRPGPLRLTFHCAQSTMAQRQLVCSFLAVQLDHRESEWYLNSLRSRIHNSWDVPRVGVNRKVTTKLSTPMTCIRHPVGFIDHVLVWSVGSVANLFWKTAHVFCWSK